MLSYPPSLRRLAGDTDAVSAARLGPGGAFQLYLNATPRQGAERLQHWAAFRLRLLRSDDAASAHEVGAAEGVKFRGGTGSCVIDAYVTRIGAPPLPGDRLPGPGTDQRQRHRRGRPGRHVGPGAPAPVPGGGRLPRPLTTAGERERSST